MLIFTVLAISENLIAETAYKLTSNFTNGT